MLRRRAGEEDLGVEKSELKRIHRIHRIRKEGVPTDPLICPLLPLYVDERPEPLAGLLSRSSAIVREHEY